MMLEPWEGRRVVDLYAGSGALGIEALSRGAHWVDFVESGRHALAALEQNLESLGLAERATVWRLALPAGLGRLSRQLEQADVVLLDPPYGGTPARRTLEALERTGAIGRDCRVVLEHHAKDEVPERLGAIRRDSDRRYGETMITFYRAAGEPPGNA